MAVVCVSSTSFSVLYTWRVILSHVPGIIAAIMPTLVVLPCLPNSEYLTYNWQLLPISSTHSIWLLQAYVRTVGVSTWFTDSSLIRNKYTFGRLFLDWALAWMMIPLFKQSEPAPLPANHWNIKYRKFSSITFESMAGLVCLCGKRYAHRKTGFRRSVKWKLDVFIFVKKNNKTLEEWSLIGCYPLLVNILYKCRIEENFELAGAGYL